MTDETTDTTAVDDQAVLGLMSTAATIVGPIAAGATLDEHLAKVLSVAQLLPAAVKQFRQAAGSDPAQYQGVLISAELNDRNKAVYTFLPTIGRYAGKYIDPAEKPGPQGQSAHDTNGGGKYVPATETWTSDFLAQRNGTATTAAAEYERAVGYIGRHVAYRTHREHPDGAPKGGYRVFDGFVGITDVPDTALAGLLTNLAGQLGVTANLESGDAGDGPATTPAVDAEPSPATTASVPDVSPVENAPPTAASSSGHVPVVELVAMRGRQFSEAAELLPAAEAIGFTSDDVKKAATDVIGDGPREGENLTRLFDHLITQALRKTTFASPNDLLADAGLLGYTQTDVAAAATDVIGDGPREGENLTRLWNHLVTQWVSQTVAAAF